MGQIPKYTVGMKNKLLLVMLAVSFASFANAEISIDALIDQAGIAEGDTEIRSHAKWRGAKKVLLRNIGVDVQALQSTAGDVEFVMINSADEAMRHAADADAIIGYCDADLIAATKQLVWVQIFSAGAERCLSVDRIASGDVVLTNMQKMSSPVIAEHSIAMMMALMRNLPQFVNAMDEADWNDARSQNSGMMSVSGKRLLVAGLGGIGTEVARLGAALGMRVSGTRNSSREGPDFVEYVGLSDELLTLAAEADVVVNALPLTSSTSDLFDKAFFEAIKPGAIFVNVGRGKTVVTSELIAALDSGRVAGAGLDVTEPEPLPANSPLWRRDDVIITPHVAGSGGERERHAVLLAENIRRYLAGDRLLNVVDPDKGY